MSECPVCAAKLSPGLRPWHCICRACGYEGSTLHANILGQTPGGSLDETAREDALEALRRSNFRRLLITISRLVRRSSSSRPRLLDVGSAHGWFLELAREGYDAMGIEPDRGVIAVATAKGLHVRDGFFPGVLDADERFDVIVFNDVLEHIPDVQATMTACADHLVPGGLLVVNAPSRRGAMYWVSKQLLRLGRPGAFDRLWQCGFPSPHVHYFDTNSIERLGERYGFTLTGSERLPSVSVSGLYSRVRYSKKVSAVKAAILTAAISAAVPALALLPPDIEVWFLGKNGS